VRAYYTRTKAIIRVGFQLQFANVNLFFSAEGRLFNTVDNKNKNKMLIIK